jgi:ABC-2 type transport system ATP-binding protein
MFKFKSNKTTEIQHALKEISFDVKKGEFFGIVGRNGSGKSTLLKILAGIYQPSKGKVSIGGKLVPFIELGVGFNSELSGRENVYLNGAMLGFSESEITDIYDEIVSFAELERFMDQKLKNYSSGMQVRLAFSMAIRAEADILLVDEVLAVGDASFQRKCFEYFKELKQKKKTVVFVTHDMNSVREYCDKAILINKNRIVASGSADEIASKYTRMFFDKTYEASDAKEYTRWGDGAVKYTSLDIDVTEEHVNVKLNAKAFSDMDSPNFGLTIKNTAGQGILGTNTNIKNERLPHLKNGQEVELSWTFPNILNDGEYYVEPAIVWQDGRVADWWERAKSIKIQKEEHTPHAVAPFIELKLKQVK